MFSTTVDIREFLAGLLPFQQLPEKILDHISQQCQFLKYRMGQAIATREAMPEYISIIYHGQARLLALDIRNDRPETLTLLQPGEICGWVSHVRGVACETVIASKETVCVNLPSAEFLTLLQKQPIFAAYFQNHPSLIEIYDLLAEELSRRADGTTELGKLTITARENSQVFMAPSGKLAKQQLDGQKLWLVSSNGTELALGTSVDLNTTLKTATRLVGIPKSIFPTPANTSLAVNDTGNWLADVPYAPEDVAQGKEKANQKQEKYPYIRGRGGIEGALACFQMLSQYFRLPFRKDMLRRVLTKQQTETGNVSLQFCGAVAELVGLTTQIVKVPTKALMQMPTPVMIAWQDSFAIVYKTSPQEIVLAAPETGLIRRKPRDFVETWGEEGEVLILQPNKETRQAQFNLSWFIPALRRHRRVLIEVLIASFVIQIFGLVNPLATQVIIDKVLVGNSPDTLEVLGIFLLVVAVVEAVLTAVRTQLFVDTTNRIDLSLGSEVINHLLRLPLTYFDKRPVGELATRVNELENIRQFLTGTALTVVMDAVFSVIYIFVMAIYSWILTIVALITVPLFALLNWLVSPVMRKQLQEKAERNAETHSYLVEIMAGMQTVKAQNLELRSRWQWQERYAKYISAGFQTVSTQTTASSISSFLNKLSTLLVLWVGAYLVLQGKLTLGQLIAFRIISGYVTNPLLRLLQLWQNFQEVALSLQRLGDILDTPQETDIADKQNILMPTIVGSVRYENISFRFRQNTPLQLCNINLDFPAGSFIGIVGQSGSGKSTLLKLLPRLYEPTSGKILIDGYDISKVELYSLRRQIGVVQQDTLLFDGTVRENISLAYPDASDDEIIAAAKVAYAHEFIMALPNGYNTPVGERGSGLSGGQRQRVAIARTVLQNPQLLILDEATSALDYNAEGQVCRNLAETCKGKTVFFITHRLSTIRHADIILMMDQGAVVEQGTHAELMAMKGYYYCLYQQQEAQI
ncbi:peptidase domain-containing ABC transporter [Calothrix sp. 336/3]|uniref:peptidase domain-containing ABC transporter n=1 Tax=Calothrix sp. 336/3 TaxID=1337936 RepID=UPI0004E343C5|nr:peptidase domain-containing ABC transporter [Calothrix sp. 336/3]AKG19991.1 peptidase C39 [Calothrix sp. 336/3]